MKTKPKTAQLAILGLMAAVLLLMAFTPLGYLHVGVIAITFNMIPVAISAIALGPVGGAIAGGVFGLTSFLQCIGIGGTSALGTILFSISPIGAFLNCFLPRILDGLLIGFLFGWLRKHIHVSAACAVTGFFSAFLNTVFFMGMLVLLYGNTEYVQSWIDGRNVIVFICAVVGVNAIFEMLAATLLTGVIGTALHKAKVLPSDLS